MGDKQALLIGVGNYGEGLAPIPSALRDVDALAEVLRDPSLGGFGAVGVLKDPDRTEMETAVEALFTNRAADDLLLLYFSGHGLRDERRQLFLACCETAKVKEGPARGRLRHATALRAQTLRDYMQASPSKRQLVILDCCFSGAMAIGMTVKDDGRIDLAEALGGEGCALLTSSAATEHSQAGAPLEGEPQENGAGLSIYTRFLVEGIRTGAADRQQRGVVDAKDLHEYVRRRLGEVNPAQTPEFYPTRTGYSIVVSRVPRDPTVEYRKQVQTLAEERRGDISPAGRIFLDALMGDLGLSPSEALRIETEVLQPFREYEEKLGRYRQALESTLAALPQQGSFLSDNDRKDLVRIQERFKLDPSDIESLHQQLGIRFRVADAAREAKPRSESQARSKTPSVDGVQPSSSSVSQSTEQISTPTMGAVRLVTIPTTYGWLVREDDRWEKKTKKIEVQGYDEELAPGVALTMIQIPAGTFQMGSPQGEEGRSVDEGPQHEVRVEGFFLGQTTITQAQWKEVAGWEKVERDLNPVTSMDEGENRPVRNVSWYDAIEFCRRLNEHLGRNYGLPSEAQWEYACRAGTTTAFHFGESITKDWACFYVGSSAGLFSKLKTCLSIPTTVASFPANAWGLHDMHGNVWEWCADHWHADYQSAGGDDQPWIITAAAASEARVLRGGSSRDMIWQCRSASRSCLDPRQDSSLDSRGFRVCCLPPKLS
jgi:formylglycine-generating enzyme required for sulfatase activity